LGEKKLRIPQVTLSLFGSLTLAAGISRKVTSEMDSGALTS